jgi:glycosyltransferase involved in cell wall biosynthesis
VNLTASQSEGWSLTVMEAALCRTPSVALAVGGLAESIVDGETGYLAQDGAQLIARTRELVDRPELRERFGEAAQRRASGFTWDRSASAFLDVLRRAAGRPPEGPRADAPVSLNGHGAGDRHAGERPSTAAENH